MHLPTLYAALLTLTTPSLALRIGTYNSSYVPPKLPPSLVIPVYSFYAFIATPDAYQVPSEIDFVISDRSYTTPCISSSETYETLFSDYKYYPCEVNRWYPDISFSFRISENFKEITIKKSWNNNGTHITGFATQETNWNEAEGGNVTTSDSGKYYRRFNKWDFQITSLVA